MSEYDDFLERGPAVRPPEVDPYMRAAGEMRGAQDAKLRASLLNATAYKAPEMAEALSLAQRTGQSPWAVANNLKEVRDTVANNDYFAALDTAAGTRRFFTDPFNASLAREAAPSLSLLEQGWDGVRALVGEAVKFPGSAASGVGEFYNIAGRALGRPVRSALDALGLTTPGKEIAPILPWYLQPGEIVKRPGELVKRAGEAIGPPPERQTLFTDVVGGVGQLGAQIGLAIVSGGLATPVMTGSLLGSGVDQLSERAVKAGKYGTVEGDSASVLGGAVTALTERMGLDLLLRRVTPDLRSAIVTKIVDVAAHGGIEAAQEVVEGILQNLVERALLDPKAPIFEGLDREALAAGGAGAIARALVMAVTPGRQRAAAQGHAERSAQTAEAFNAFTDKVAADPLLKLSPEKFGEWAKGVDPDTSVYIDAGKALEYFQSLPDAEAERLAREWGVFDQLGEAVASGGDIVMSAADYWAKVVPAGAHKAFAEDIRLGAGDFTLSEVKRFKETEGQWEPEALAAEIEAERKAREPVDRVHDDVMRQAQAAGFNSDSAAQYAALYAARYAARAARLGGDAWQLYQRSGVEIRSEFPAVLRAVPPDQMDMLINAWRKGGKDVASQRSLMGPSLLEFVSKRGGIVDTGGELAAMDADKWHRAKPFRDRLVRENADDSRQLSMGKRAERKPIYPDDVALAAWEEGYFPDITERPTTDDLFDAIREELAGNPRFVATNTRDWRADYKASLEALDVALSHIDLDVKKATNAEVKAALAKLEADAGGRGYEQPVYHGTPHAFDRFSLDKIGTGEGAAAYGHGLYFASTREVAEHYRSTLAKEPSAGRVYHAEIPANDKYLLWDKPLSEQPESVRKAVEAIYKDDPSFLKGGNDPTGQRVVEDLRLGMDARRASMALLEAGIPGIKYLDGSSRTKGDGSYNYVIFDDKLVSIAEYEQQARGKIAFSDGRSIITLFQGRNLSTVLHETGHLWLEELRADAALAEAPDDLRADLATVEKFLGLKPGQAPEVEHHEKFARAVEAYLMEGKSPSVELSGVFAKFRAWLVSIYKTVAGLNVRLDPDIRGVFDRLVATPEQIEHAQSEVGARQLFASADQAGMTEAEFAAYGRTVERARDTAETTLLRKLMADIRRQRTEEWRKEQAAVRAEVRDEVSREPVFLALHFLRTGRMLDGAPVEALRRMKLSADDVKDMYGAPTALDALPKSVPPIYAEKGGVHPDALAEMFGYESGRAMVDALIALEAARVAMKASGDDRSVMRARIDAETERRMMERHGDALNDGSIEEEALAAVHNKGRGDVLAAELRALGRKAGAEPTPASVIRAWAARQIAGKTVREAATGRAVEGYLRAEGKAGRAAEAAMLKGDHDEAFRQKQRQMIDHALYMEAKAAREEIESGRKRMDRYAQARTIKSMDQDYLEQIHALLERFSLRPATLRDQARRVSLREWAVAREAEGRDVAVPEKLLDEAFKRQVAEMTIEEFRGLADSVDQIAHLGRLKRELLDGKEKREFEAVVDEAVAVVEKTPQRGVTPETRGKGPWETKLGAPSRWLRGADASLLKIETLIDWLDGGNPNGVFNRIVFRPLADAQGAAFKLGRDMNRKFEALVDSVPAANRARWAEKVVLHGLPNANGEPTTLLRSQLVAVALNTGNDSNRDKLLKGEKWDADALDAALNREMTADDWKFVQGAWDLIETLWPEIAAMERRVNGVAPPRVEAREVVTPHGTFRGGYYPLVYDPNKALDVRQRGEKAADALFENTYQRATTPRGFTKERSEGYARPLWLDLDVVPRHLQEVVHDVTHREAILQADKFLRDQRVAEAVIAAVGPEYQAQFNPWLQNIANEWASDKRGLAWWESFAKDARTHVTLVGMGFRASTVIAQIGGYADSSERIGARWLGSGLKAFLASPRDSYAFITEKSAEMASRFGQMERDVRQQMRDLTGKTGLVAEARRFAFYGIGIMDMAVAAPTWMGAYNRALSEGMADADAVYAADKAVRDSQGSGHAKDLAAIQRGNEVTRLATMFYSYMSHLYQRQRQLVRDVREADSVEDFAMIAARSWWLFAVAPIVNALMGGNGPEDEENWLTWAARKMVFNLPMSVPVLRDVANPVERAVGGKPAFGYAFTPVERAATTFINVGDDMVDLVKGQPVSEGALKRAIELPGYLLGLPTGQLGATSQYLWDVLRDGQHNPKDLKDWMAGVTYGPPEKKR